VFSAQISYLKSELIYLVRWRLYLILSGRIYKRMTNIRKSIKLETRIKTKAILISKSRKF